LDIVSRFKCQRISQQIHLKHRNPDEKAPRVCNCFRLKRRGSYSTTLRKKPEAKRAHYGDLQTCGSVWACPVCSSIISERRSLELQAAIESWTSRDYENSIVMVTWTTPHYITQTLEEVLVIQDRAMRIMKKQPQKGRYKVYRTVMDEMMSLGAYTGREITFGRNGWHPHRHDIHFTIRATTEQLQGWRDELAEAFLIAFEKAGGVVQDKGAFLQRSVKVDQITPDNNGFVRVAQYITTVEGDNWSLAKEATKGITKTAKNGNVTPFGMLSAIMAGDKSAKLYALKFYEYAQTMHGKKQFFPTPGLARFLKVQHKTDEEIIKESEAGNHYATLTNQQWQEILTFDIRGDVLKLTEGVTEFEFFDLLEDYLQTYKEKAA